MLVRAVLGRQDCVPLGTLSVPGACSGEVGSTCRKVPMEGAISGRCCQQLNLFVEQFKLVDTLQRSLGRIPRSLVGRDCCGSEVCASPQLCFAEQSGDLSQTCAR